MIANGFPLLAFIISDVEETQSFEVNDSRFDRKFECSYHGVQTTLCLETMSEDDDPDKVSMESHQSDRKTTNDIDDQDKEGKQNQREV